MPGLTAPFDVAGLPFILTPTLRATTLLWSPTPLSYGRASALLDDTGKAIGSGAPALNGANHRFYFTGRSDGFAYDPSKPAVFPNLSNNPNNARLDPESTESYIGMGFTAERVADRWKISRDDQDRWALGSQQKAARALADGTFKDQIVPIEVEEVTWNGAKKEEHTRTFDRDELPEPVK